MTDVESGKNDTTGTAGEKSPNIKIVKWINIMVRATTAGLASAYFATTSSTHCVLDTNSTTIINSIGLVLSLIACFMSLVSAFFGTEFAVKGNFAKEYIKQEHLTTTFANITLFALLGISSGLTLTGNTSGDLLTTLTIISMFVARIALKFEFLLVSEVAESTKMQNFLSILFFGLAIFNEQRVKTEIAWVIWIIAIAAALQFVLAVSKQIAPDPSKARTKLEEGTGAVINFVILGLAISQASDLSGIRTVLLILLADIVSRASVTVAKVQTFDAAFGAKLAGTRVATAVLGALLLWQSAEQLDSATGLNTGYLNNIVGVLLGAGLVKLLVGFCALLDSPYDKTTYNMQMYNYLNNGGTTVALLGSVAVLTDAIAQSKNEVYPAFLLVTALTARAVDLFQNSIERDEYDYKKSSFDRDEDDIGKMKADNYKVWVVLISMAASLTTLLMQPSDSDDSNVVIAATIGIALHLTLVVLAMIASTLDLDTFQKVCVSTIEFVRLSVATTILGLVTSIAVNRPTILPVCTVVAYAMADIYGMGVV